MKQRIVLWGALGALAVGAGALVTVSTLGGDDDAPPALPLALAGSGPGAGDAAAAASAEALTIAPGPTTYVAGEGLPELGGEAEAHRLPAEVPSGAVADLAEALAIDGEPVEAADSWTVAGDELTLSVVPVTGTWSAYRTAVPEPAPLPAPAPDQGGGTSASPPSGAGSGGASGSEGEAVGEPVPPDATPSTIVCVTTPCEPAPADDVPAGSAPCAAAECSSPVTPDEPVACAATTCPGSAPACPPDPATSCAPACPDDPAVACATGCAAAVPEDGANAGADVATVCPADAPVAGLPREEAARDQAVALLEATGLDVGDAEVEAVGGVTNWTVSVEPRFAGVAAPGLAGYVTVGPEGVIESASGPLLPAEPLGEYPLLTTAEAIDRLNEPGDVSVGSPGGPAIDVPASAPVTTGPAEQPTSDADSSGATGAAGDIQGLRTQTTRPEGPPMTPGTAMPPDGFATTTATAGAPGATATTAAPTTGTAVTPIEPSAPSTGTASPTEPVPLPEPQPTEVVLADAELVYLAVASWDGSGTYLVPGYRFTPADAPEGAEGPTVPAVEDDALAPPVDTATTEPPDSGSGLPEPGGMEPGQPEPGGMEPATEPGQVEPAAPSTTTVDAGG